MTETPSQTPVEVTQADREAAAELGLYLFAEDYSQEMLQRIVDHFRSGKADNEASIQAFARHRLASTPAQVGGDAGGLVERVDAFTTCGCSDEDWPQLGRDITDTILALQAENTQVKSAWSHMTDDNKIAWGKVAELQARVGALEEGHVIDLAAMIYSGEECDDERGETPTDWFGHCRRNIVEGKDAAHFGDCTKQPQTCIRCVAEHYLIRARSLAKADGEGGVG